MSKTVHVGLLFNYNYSFYRNLLGGVREFAETRRDWVFFAGQRRKGTSALAWKGDAQRQTRRA